MLNQPSASPDRAAGPAKRGAPARFTRDTLVSIATAIIDEQGVDGLTLRAVAAKLEVTPMALYTYVASKDELVDLALAALVLDARSRRPVPDAWDNALRELAHGLRELVLTHPTLVGAYQRGLMSFPEASDITEQILSVLCTAGFSRSDARDAYLTVHMFALGYAATENASDGSRADFERCLEITLQGVRQMPSAGAPRSRRKAGPARA